MLDSFESRSRLVGVSEVLSAGAERGGLAVFDRERPTGLNF